MARQITISKFSEPDINTSYNNKMIFEVDSTPKMLKLKEIKKSELFAELFKIDQEVLYSITDDMQLRGFDKNQPVIIWKEKEFLIDGHTRLLAAEKAGIASIPAIYASFDTEEDVLDYMYRLQFNRRNITDKDLIDLVSKTLTKFDNKYGEGSKAEFISKQFYGLSVGKAKQILVVLERASEKEIDAIRSEITSIHQVYLSCKNKTDKLHAEPKEKENFWSYDEKRTIRFDEKGAFYLRDYSNEKELKIFTLSKDFNTNVVKQKLQTFIENEVVNHPDNE